MKPESLSQTEYIAESPLFYSPQRERIRLRTRELVERIIRDTIDVVVFLDRSARPLEWMMQAAWQAYGQGHAMPEIRFANIGREKRDLLHYAPPTPEDNFDSWQLKTAERRFAALHEDNDYFEKLQKSLAGGKEFTGNVMVVDDYAGSGYSLRTAISLFSHYFPKACVDGFLFFTLKDTDVFPNPDPQKKIYGPYLPWTEDRALLVKESEDVKLLVAEREDDGEKIARGRILRENIEQIFIEGEDNR